MQLTASRQHPRREEGTPFMKRYFILALAMSLSAAGACDDSEDASSGAVGAAGSDSSEAGGSTAGKAAGGSGGKAAGGSAAAGKAAGGTGGTATSNNNTNAGGSGGSAGAAGKPGTANAGASGGVGGKAAAEPAAGSGGTAAVAGDKDIVDTAVAAGSFKQLARALTKANLVDALKGAGPFTVFAPTDAAFDALEKAKPGTVAGLSVEQLTNVLKYHVVSGAAVKAADLKNGELVKTLAGSVAAIDLSGDKPKINGVTISTTDIMAKNGVIHVIDAVLLPPGDIIEVATAAGKFGKLAAALTAAGLVDDLKGEGPFTVFAPTDEAFAKLSAAPSGDALKDVLLYHVISGALGPVDLKEGGAATTLAGSPVLFALKDGAKINDAKITTTNVVAKNGVIHIIDTVIVPPADDVVATAIAAGTFTKLAGALTSAGLVSALEAKGPFTVFAPTDDAFAKLSAVPSGDALKNVLLYHVVEGAVGAGDLKAGQVPTLLKDKSLSIDLSSGVKVNSSSVIKANILTKNGIIHVVDSVLVPN
jgi:transforming growth factor-beta-induced protein